MPHAVQIEVPGRQMYRRDLPASWKEVAESRRLPLLRHLLTQPGPAGQVLALRDLLALPRGVFKNLYDDQVAQLLALCPWMEMKPDASPRIESFEHAGRRYFLPGAHGLNLVAIEYPLADEAFLQFVRDGKQEGLTMLCAVLCREKNPDAAAVRTRGDQRVPLLTRYEAEARALDLSGLSPDVAMTVLLYFAGVKEFVHKSYGQVLFDQPDPDEPQAAPTAPGLGWWGLYFQIAESPDCDRLYQTPFHDVCCFMVDRIKAQKDREMQTRLQSPDFGIDNPKG